MSRFDEEPDAPLHGECAAEHDSPVALGTVDEMDCAGLHDLLADVLKNVFGLLLQAYCVVQCGCGEPGGHQAVQCDQRDHQAECQPDHDFGQ